MRTQCPRCGLSLQCVRCDELVPYYNQGGAMSAAQHPARRDIIDAVWRQTLDNGTYTAEVLRLTDYAGTLQLRRGDHVIASKPVSMAYGAQFGPDVDDVIAWQITVIKWLESRDL